MRFNPRWLLSPLIMPKKKGEISIITMILNVLEEEFLIRITVHDTFILFEIIYELYATELITQDEEREDYIVVEQLHLLTIYNILKQVTNNIVAYNIHDSEDIDEIERYYKDTLPNEYQVQLYKKMTSVKGVDLQNEMKRVKPIIVNKLGEYHGMLRMEDKHHDRHPDKFESMCHIIKCAIEDLFSGVKVKCNVANTEDVWNNKKYGPIVAVCSYVACFFDSIPIETSLDIWLDMRDILINRFKDVNTMEGLQASYTIYIKDEMNWSYTDGNWNLLRNMYFGSGNNCQARALILFNCFKYSSVNGNIVIFSTASHLGVIIGSKDTDEVQWNSNGKFGKPEKGIELQMTNEQLLGLYLLIECAVERHNVYPEILEDMLKVTPSTYVPLERFLLDVPRKFLYSRMDVTMYLYILLKYYEGTIANFFDDDDERVFVSSMYRFRIQPEDARKNRMIWYDEGKKDQENFYIDEVNKILSWLYERGIHEVKVSQSRTNEHSFTPLEHELSEPEEKEAN